MKDAYIIAGGSFDKKAFSAFLKKRKKKTKRDVCYIAADSGISGFCDIGEQPDFVVGDFDSASLSDKAMVETLAECGVPVIFLKPEKDDTDTEAALDIALRVTDGDIYIWGGIGTRVDHILSNIQILFKALEAGRNAYLCDARNFIQLCDRNFPRTILKSEQFGNFVSVIPMTARLDGLTLKGFKYELVNKSLCMGSSLGQSNEIVADSATISVEAGVAIVVESRD
jgi:thiamine pyrophosphokinase